MRLIGLIGGMSWESSALYYRLLNEGTAARLGGLHSAHCLLYSVDFARIEVLQSSGRWEEAGAELARAAVALEAAGAEVLVLCTNTMHRVADHIEASTSVPLLHLADVTVRAVQAAGVAKVGLLGTAFTMEQPFYRDRLKDHGLEVVVPDVSDRAALHQIIYEELCRGIISEESREVARGIARRLVAQGAEGVILGCTEIELLMSADDSPVLVFPTTQLHVTAALDWAGLPPEVTSVP